MSGIVGIVLCGGRSSRMGRNKALMPLQGKVLVDRMVDLLKQAGVAEVWISGAVEGRSSIPDAVPFAGPGAAIARLVPRLGGRAGLIVSVDMPLLRPETLRALIGEASAYYRGHPLPMFVEAGAACPLTCVSVRDVLAALEARALEVACGTEGEFVNLNTPEDWVEALGE